MPGRERDPIVVLSCLLLPRVRRRDIPPLSFPTLLSGSLGSDVTSVNIAAGENGDGSRER